MNDLEVGRGKIMALQTAMLKLPQVEMEKQHHFAKGVYARELHIPKGVALVGRIHLQSQINIISKGDISVMTENGLVRVKAPCTIVSPAGVKRAGYAHEDTVWTTILGTDKTDIIDIHDTLTCIDFEQYEKQTRQLGEGVHHGV